MIKREYKVEGRNGYYAVDEYLGKRCIRTIHAGIKSKKQAIQIADEIENAVNQFIIDNNLDLDLGEKQNA